MNIEQFILHVEKLHIVVSNTQLEQLEQYYQLLIEWNKVINLTGITEKKDVYLKHFYDSLTLCKSIDLMQYTTLCDIGTGAGFPGLVLKIFFPHLEITLVDSLNKRLQFLNTVIDKLHLTGIHTVHSRAEEYQQKNHFDIVTARAVSSLNLLIEYCIPLLKINGYAIFLKGNIDQEIIQSQKALVELKCEIIDKISFSLPYENSQRTILKIKKISINQKYPRKYSEIKKHPL